MLAQRPFSPMPRRCSPTADDDVVGARRRRLARGLRGAPAHRRDEEGRGADGASGDVVAGRAVAARTTPRRATLERLARAERRVLREVRLHLHRASRPGSPRREMLALLEQRIGERPQATEIENAARRAGEDHAAAPREVAARARRDGATHGNQHAHPRHDARPARRAASRSRSSITRRRRVGAGRRGHDQRRRPREAAAADSDAPGRARTASRFDVAPYFERARRRRLLPGGHHHLHRAQPGASTTTCRCCSTRSATRRTGAPDASIARASRSRAERFAPVRRRRIARASATA